MAFLSNLETPNSQFAIRNLQFLRSRTVLAGALAIHLAIMSGVFILTAGWGSGDFDRFWEISTTPGRPYLDFPVERAPAEVVLIKAIALATGTRERFGRGALLVNVAADATIVSALAWAWGLEAAAFYAVTSIPLLKLLAERIDLWSVAMVSLALAAWKRDRRILTSAGLAVGTALKLWPLPFSVLLALPAPGLRRLAGLVAFVVIGLALAGMWWALAGWSGLYQVVTFRGARGWQIESSVGSLLMLAGSKSRLEAGALRTGSTNAFVTVLMFVVAAPMSIWAVWRGGRTGHLGAAWLASVGTLLLLSALFSAQFAGWLIAGGAIAWAEGDKRLAILTAVAYAITFSFTTFYTSVIDGYFPAVTVVVFRNVIMVMLVIEAFRILMKRSRRLC
ncbi:MAG TPA: hypothetical protein VNZ26_10180 [Vicinamibacterales bacterium]|jgi:hypothetical protein|nr:hypothetical protein [Vicinamibacterales bacterium]